MASYTPLDARPWREVEITLEADASVSNPYTEVEAWADFRHESGRTLRRPAFWDGGRTWRIRFAPPEPAGTWTWESGANAAGQALAGRAGRIRVEPPAQPEEHRFYRHGFWRMSPGKRNVVHADGTAAIIVGDTAWALPWRATPDQCSRYAQFRREQGFNAALLMTVQPDMKAEGPRDRTKDLGFAVGFEDLSEGHLNEPNPEYFREFDELVAILVAHEIVPVFQPVFHGYGWKGLKTAGGRVPAEEYARYCRYLVARYGARPAIYLVGGDGKGTDPGIDLGGREVEAWDGYEQPAGIHYCPHATNRACQDREWLDFQWCQTGHSGEHLPERVADMWRNEPIKGVANGEPSYERMTGSDAASGWWQGHEAWCNLCAGGTMGVFYGAGSLWQWKLHPGEPGHADWCCDPGAGWEEGLGFEGARYVGIVGEILRDLPFADMAPTWDYTLGGRGLAVPDRFFLTYMEGRRSNRILDSRVPPHYRAYNPKTGELVETGELPDGGGEIRNDTDEPRVYIFVAE